jgi:HlyD family secretion protein
MKSRAWKIGLAAVALGFAAAFAWRHFSSPGIELAEVARRDVVQSVVASGRVATPNRVDIGAQITGTVEAVPVAEGDTVRAGQTLIVLESSEARANEAQAKATLDNARAQLERNKRLATQGFLGKSALDDAVRNFEVARTSLEAARAKLAYANIRAAVAGTLIARDVEKGESVQPGKVLLVLAPAGETQIVLQIDERNLSRLKIGQKALASADAYPAQRFEAELFYINPGVDAQRGTVEVKLRVPAPPAYLRQDMTVSADIEVERHPAALALAAEAVRDPSGAAPWVLVVREGRARRQAVKLGLRGEGSVEIVDGLAEGERVLPATSPVKAGQRVRSPGA